MVHVFVVGVTAVGKVSERKMLMIILMFIIVMTLIVNTNINHHLPFSHPITIYSSLDFPHPSPSSSQALLLLRSHPNSVHKCSHDSSKSW